MHQSWMFSIQLKKVFSQNFGKNCRAALAHRSDRLLRHRLHAHEPLLREHRLDDGIAARAGPDRVGMLFLLFVEARGLEIREDAFARGLAIQPGIGTGVFVHPRARIHHRNLGQPVTPPHLEVVEIMRRSNLHRAGAECAIDRRIRDDRNLAPNQRHPHILADQRAIAIRPRDSPRPQYRRASSRAASSQLRYSRSHR